MAAAMGFETKLGMITEVTPGTPLAPTEQYEVLVTDLRMNEELLDAAGLRGTRSHVSERVRQGTRAPGFSITLQPNSVELDALLPRILGGSESLDSFPLAETLPSFTTKIEVVQTRLVFAGCKVARARFVSSQGSPLNLELDVEAMDLTTEGTAFPALTINTVGPYIHSDLAATVSATTYRFREVALAIDNGLKVDRFLNSQTRLSLPEQDRVITWTLDGPYGDNSALYGLAVAGVAVVGTWTLSNRSLAFSSTKVQFPRIPPRISGRDEIMLPLEGIARKDGSTNELTCTNDSTP